MARFAIIILAFSLFSGTLFADTTAPLPEDPPDVVRAQTSARDEVKGLSWLEITTFSPAFTPVDEAFAKRMEKTWKMKLRVFRRNAAIPAHFNFDPALKAQWKKVVEECTRIIKGS